jgi:hypothetical protein
MIKKGGEPVVKCHVIYVYYMLSLACNAFLQSRLKINPTVHKRLQFQPLYALSTP